MEGGCFGGLRERGIWLALVPLLSLLFFYVIWSTPTNVPFKTMRTMPVNNEGRSLVNTKSGEKFFTFGTTFNYLPTMSLKLGGDVN